MTGSLDNDTSLANGIPAREIGPETGSFGDATMTNTGSTSQGASTAYDSSPAPAAGLEAPTVVSPDVDLHEERSFASDRSYNSNIDVGSTLASDEESVAQQIADGEGRIKHGEDLHKRLHPRD